MCNVYGWRWESENLQIFFFYVLLTVHPCIICFKWSQLGVHYFLVYLFLLLYMFRATMCPSSGELSVSVRQWYFSLCMGGCLVCCSRPESHPYKSVHLLASFEKDCKCLLKKQDGQTWTGFSWLTVGTSGGLLRRREWALVFYKFYESVMVPEGQKLH